MHDLNIFKYKQISKIKVNQYLNLGNTNHNLSQKISIVIKSRITWRGLLTSGGCEINFIDINDAWLVIYISVKVSGKAIQTRGLCVNFSKANFYSDS